MGDLSGVAARTGNLYKKESRKTIYNKKIRVDQNQQNVSMDETIIEIYKMLEAV